MGALCMAFHKLAQQQLPVALVGAGLPPLPSQLRSAKPYAERLFEYFPLGALTDAAARSALVTPATRKGADYERGRGRADPRRSRRLPVLHPGVRPRRLGGGGRLADHGRRRCARRSRSRRRSSTRSSSTTASRRRRTRSAATWRRWPTSATARSRTGESHDHARGLQEARLVGQGAPGADPQGPDLRRRSTARSTSPCPTSPTFMRRRYPLAILLGHGRGGRGLTAVMRPKRALRAAVRSSEPGSRRPRGCRRSAGSRL